MYVQPPVRTWLRVEGFAILGLAATFFGMIGGDWTLFALLFFAPDLSFLGYLAGPRVGAIAYNFAHTYASPATLLVAALVLYRGPGEQPGAITATVLSVIWVAHIGFDRAVGYGLKYPMAFDETHLGRIGRAARR